MVVGSAWDDVGANSDQGSAYVFFRSGGLWSQQTQLTASDGAADDLFGNSLAISGNTILVGSPRDDSGNGSAYVFLQAGGVWSEQAKLTASDEVRGLFGSSVAVRGGIAIVGAPWDEFLGGTNEGKGSAYALEVATGQVQVGHYARRRRREFLDFMNDLVAVYPDSELHVILDNLNIHKPKQDRWLQHHPRVHLHFTPTAASWLNLIEVWFSILSRQALRNLSCTEVRQLREAIDRFVGAYKKIAAPFEWTKTEVHPAGLKKRYSDLCK